MRRSVALSIIMCALLLAVAAVRPASATSHRVFRFAWIEPTDPIDPRLAEGPLPRAITQNLFEGLAGLDSKGEPRLLGAERYESSPDGLTWIFHLRRQARWSDGTAVTAHDYELAMKSTLEPKFPSRVAGLLYVLKNAEAYHKGTLADAAKLGVSALDDFRLRLELERPTANLIRHVAGTWFWPVPRHVVQKHGSKWTEADNIVTNGPYVLKEWKHEVSMVMVPNPRYWGARPGVDRVDIRLISDPVGRALPAFEAGEVDFAHVPSTELKRIRASAQLGPMLRFAAVPRLYVVFMDTAKRPFEDARVRKAFYLALDRGKLAELYDGLLVPTWTLTPHLISSHSKSIRLPGTPDDARRLLADAGYPNGAGFPPVTMVVRATQVEQLFGQASQSMWKQVLNVDVKLQVLDAQAFRAWRVAIQKQPYDLFNTSSTADIPDAWVYHNFLFGTDYFSSRWRNARYLELAGRAERELNLQRRDELYQQLDRMVVEEDTVVIPWSNDQIAYLVRPRFKGLGIIFGTQGPSLTELQVTP